MIATMDNQISVKVISEKYDTEILWRENRLKDKLLDERQKIKILAEVDVLKDLRKDLKNYGK